MSQEDLIEITAKQINGRKIEDISMRLAVGDLYKICNVLADYASLLRESAADHKEADEVGNAFTIAYYNLYASQLDEVRKKIEKATDYNVAEAVERCRIKRLKPRKEQDYGADGLTLSFTRSRAPSRKKKEEAKKETPKDDGNNIENQMSIEDFLDQGDDNKC